MPEFMPERKKFGAENGSSGAFEEIKIQRMSESIISGAYAGTKKVRRRKRRIRRFCENVNTAQDRKHFIRSLCRNEKSSAQKTARPMLLKK